MEWNKLVHGTAPHTPPAAFGTGDEVRVWYRILEQGKERFGQFEGIVIRCRGSGSSKTFTVRRVTHGEGVERVFPMDAKTISRIEVLRKGRVKRGRLYFLRTVIGKTRIAADESASGTEKPANAPSPSAPPIDAAPPAQNPPRAADAIEPVATRPSHKS